MKYLMMFEELKSEIYKKAGQKLKELGQMSRGEELIKYSLSKNESYNFTLIFEVYGYNDSDEYHTIKEYSHNVKAYFDHVNFWIDGESIDDLSLEEAIKRFLSNSSDINYSINLALDFYFIIDDNDVKKYNYDSNIFNAFCIQIDLYSNLDEINDKNHKYDIRLEIPSDMTNLNDDTFSIGFPLRNSGLKVKKLIIDKIIESDIVRNYNLFLDADVNHYTKFLKDLDSININKICRDTDIKGSINLN